MDIKRRENANSNMADNEGRQRAIALLQEATRLIGEESQSVNMETNQYTISQGQQHHEGTENTQRPLHNASRRTSTSLTRSPSLSAINNSVRERSLGNFRDLFAPYRSTNRGLSSSNQEAIPPRK